MSNNLSIREQQELRDKLEIEIKKKLKLERENLTEGVKSLIANDNYDVAINSITVSKNKILKYENYLVVLDDFQRTLIKKRIQNMTTVNIDRVKSISKTALMNVKKRLENTFNSLKNNINVTGKKTTNTYVEDIVKTIPIFKKQKVNQKMYDINLTNLDLIATKLILKIDNFFGVLSNSIKFKSCHFLSLISQKINLGKSYIGTYKKEAIDNFIYLLEEREKRIATERVILENDIKIEREKRDVLTEERKKIRIKRDGYINFYLILISTIFLSLLSILLAFKILGY